MGASIMADQKLQNKKHSKKRNSVKVFKKPKVKKHDVFVQQRDELIKKYDLIDSDSIETFDQIPLSSQTLEGLKKKNFEKLTDIQKASICPALKGQDILGAAKTGSGKTLAFVIPVLECLFREGWSRPAGLGALVITPTRELAYQIFQVFSSVGAAHDFTVALVIGGKDLAYERQVLNQYNIVICTPGRLLQHMDENPLFDAVTLQILVLDEADKILDLGFANTMNAIIENLPQERQTLLFSATQTKSVKDLARLSLKNPMYVSVHEHDKYITPESLEQSYLVCEAHQKIDFLWSFLKNHKKQKILVFMASCKQVKYTFESFCRMKPGISITALYGSLHQLKRMERYTGFCKKQHAVMFATDIAARGLDFPNVNWVVQLDCPEDVNTYIHRAGRTARYQEGGESLLVLLPSEKDSMVEQVNSRRIPINEIEVNTKKLFSIANKLKNLCFRDANLSASAQRAFNAYLKSIFLMKDKTVFDVQKINNEAYARSLGLQTTPRTRFIQKHLKKQQETKQSSDTTSNEVENPDATQRPNVGNEWNNLGDSDGSDGDDDDLKTCRTFEPLPEENVVENFLEPIEPTLSKSKKNKPVTKAALVKKILKQKIKVNKKVVFDEDDEDLIDENKDSSLGVINEVFGDFDDEGHSPDKAKRFMAEQDKIDKEVYKQKVKEKHRLERIKRKDLNRKNQPANFAGEGSAKDSEGDSDAFENIDREGYIDELPDPDKYFGQNPEDSEISETHQPQDLKRKKKQISSAQKRVKSSKSMESAAVLDEEDFALQLLQNS